MIKGGKQRALSTEEMIKGLEDEKGRETIGALEEGGGDQGLGG